jgi:uncharacterized protein (TIGR02600 family)
MNPFHKHRASERGAALIIVLAILLIIAALTIGILGRATMEQKGAASFAAGTSARQFADMAVQVVQGQIYSASTQGISTAWASQPGMVRTFDSSGNLASVYKLYSADKMVSGNVDLNEDLPPADWKQAKGFWTDLNDPVVPVGATEDDQLVYPILDPRADEIIGTVDPVEGFSISSKPGYSGSNPAPGNNPAPMPVRWLYVLQDGSLIAPEQHQNGKISFGSQKPSKANPIVGRVAFWTDDETCKVNLNTAGEGTYWDTPRLDSRDERALGHFQPTKNEWQRYPGHPATTSLSAVFPWRNLPTTGPSHTLITPEAKLAREATRRATEISPVYLFGGSEAGTQAFLNITANRTMDYFQSGKNRERLYTSVDELLFGGNSTSANPRPVQRLFQNDDATAKQLVESRRFFATAHSRAPETNLFNLPRISIWPIHRLSGAGDYDSVRTTGFDRQIGRCSTINGQPYFFQRENHMSDADISIPRNLELLDYLENLTARPIPGFGGNFGAKFGDDRRQLLVSIYDYIRCTNLFDELLFPADGSGRYATSNLPTFTNGYTISANATDDDNTKIGHGVVVPSKLNRWGSSYKGAGRFPTITEVGFLFIAKNATVDPVDASKTNYEIQMVPLIELYEGMQGSSGMNSGNTSIRITGLNSLTLHASSLFNTNNRTLKYGNQSSGGMPTFSFLTCSGFLGFRLAASISGNLISNTVLASSNATTNSLNFTGGPLTLSILSANGIEIQRLEIESFNADIPFPVKIDDVPVIVLSNDTAVQGHLTLSSNQSLYPITSREGRAEAISANFTNSAAYWTQLSERLKGLDSQASRYPGTPDEPSRTAIILKNYDVVRSLAPSHGDHRLIALSNSNLNQPPFQEIGSWNSADRIIHTFVEAQGTGHAPGFYGLPSYHGEPNHPFRMADIPSNYTPPNAINQNGRVYHPWVTGDFDTGYGLAPDGPFFNKPDEGNTHRSNVSSLTSNSPVPYFTRYARIQGAFRTFTSPNRMMPSPAVFGSLPTGARAGIPWRTLLFRPQSGHFGQDVSPRDHLMLDFFWMPVVEPYAISEPFSTAGKINLNFQIMPFTYMERSTGMWAILKNERIGAIPNSHAPNMKVTAPQSTQHGNASNFPISSTRLPINVSATLDQFRERFNQGRIFRSASEICEIHMIPEGQSPGGNVESWAANFWANHKPTGENIRERIYATVYPRVTTKSNTFTVHMLAQSLQKTPNSDPTIWDENADKVTGEYRGSTTIERHIDPNDSRIPDYATKLNANPLPLDRFYRWRVVQNRQFAP